MTTRVDFLVFLLIVAGLASAAMNVYLTRHRAIVINFSVPVLMHQASENPAVDRKGTDEYATHAFPPGRHVCTYADTICWIKI